MAAAYEQIVLEYARRAAENPLECLDIRAACTRYLHDLASGRWDFRPSEAEMIILIIENLFCHQQGEDLSGRPLRGKPLKLMPFQLFVIYNLFGFFMPGTIIRRYQEGLVMLPRKNGKTPFATALCYGRSFSKIL